MSISVVIGLCVLALVGCYFLFFGELESRKRQLQRPKHYGECATNLALFCQTYEAFFGSVPFDQPIDNLSLPGCVRFPPRQSVQLWHTEDGMSHVHIDYGAGFEGYGYYLDRLSAPANGTNRWRLRYYREEYTRTLVEFDLPETARLPVSAFSTNAASIYLTEAPDKIDPVSEKMRAIGFLLMTGHPAASNFVANTVRTYPQAMGPRMALSLMLAAQGREEEGIRNLAESAAFAEDPSGWFWLASYQNSLGRRAEAAESLQKGIPFLETHDRRAYGTDCVEAVAVALELHRLDLVRKMVEMVDWEHITFPIDKQLLKDRLSAAAGNGLALKEDAEITEMLAKRRASPEDINFRRIIDAIRAVSSQNSP